MIRSPFCPSRPAVEHLNGYFLPKDYIFNKFVKIYFSYEKYTKFASQKRTV